MASPEAAAPLILVGLGMTGVILVQMLMVHHLHAEDVPVCLRGRVALSNDLRPWLLAASVSAALAGLLMLLVG